MQLLGFPIPFTFSFSSPSLYNNQCLMFNRIQYVWTLLENFIIFEVQVVPFHTQLGKKGLPFPTKHFIKIMCYMKQALKVSWEWKQESTAQWPSLIVLHVVMRLIFSSVASVSMHARVSLIYIPPRYPARFSNAKTVTTGSYSCLYIGRQEGLSSFYQL